MRPPSRVYDEAGDLIALSVAEAAAIGCAPATLYRHIAPHADGVRLVSRPDPERMAAAYRFLRAYDCAVRSEAAQQRYGEPAPVYLDDETIRARQGEARG